MTAKQECELLMNEMLPLAERMLREYGEFYPYGGYLTPKGEIKHLGIEDEETEHPKSQDMLYVLRESLSALAKANECRATAILFGVFVGVPGKPVKDDAIQVNLEHVDGYSAEVFFPYEITEDHRVVFGASFAQKGENEVFHP